MSYRRTPWCWVLILICLVLVHPIQSLLSEETKRGDGSAEELFQAAQDASHRGDHAQAEQLYRQLLVHDPGILPARVNLGLACYWQHKNREAIEELQAALRTRPREYSALLFSGLAYLDLGDYEQARKPLFEALRVKDTDPLLFWGLGSLAMVHADAEDAVYFLERSVALEPDNVQSVWLLGQAYARLAYQEGRPPAVPADYGSLADQTLAWLEARQADSPAAHVLKADILVGRKLTLRALTEYRRAQELDPKWPDIHLMIGSLLGLTGDWDAALAELQLQLRASPHDPRTLTEMGSVLCRAGRYEEALPLLEQALTRDPDNYETQYRFGQANVNLNKPASAIEPLLRAARLEPLRSDPYYLLQRAYRAAQQPEKAEWAFEQFNQRKANGH